MDNEESPTSNTSSNALSILSLPLAEAIRPRSLDEYIGQKHLIDPDNGAITNFMRLRYLPSMLLYGPPGVGKTTMASIIAEECGYVFVELSATAATVADLRDLSTTIMAENRKRASRGEEELKVVVFIDEIHRFTVSQQDFLLPYVEEGNFVFIGATTIDPRKRIRRAILSRVQCFSLNTLNNNEVLEVLKRAMRFENIRRKAVHGLRCIDLDDQSLSLIIKTAGGDTRKAINLIELLNTKYTDSPYKEGDNDVPIVMDFLTLKKNIRDMRYCQSGLQDPRNISLLLNMFDTMRQLPNRREVLPCSHEKIDESEPSESNSFSERMTSDLENKLYNEKEAENDDFFFKEQFKTSKFDPCDTNLNYLEQMQVSDDSDVESAPLYSDTEDETPLLNPVLSSIEEFSILSSVYSMELLLKRGESPIFICKQLLLFSVLFLDCDVLTIRKALSFWKSLKSTNLDTHMLLANFVEWLTRHSKLKSNADNDLIKQMRLSKRYLTRRNYQCQSPHSVNIEFDISYDDELVKSLETDIMTMDMNASQNAGFVISSMDEFTYEDDFCLGEYFENEMTNETKQTKVTKKRSSFLRQHIQFWRNNCAILFSEIGRFAVNLLVYEIILLFEINDGIAFVVRGLLSGVLYFIEFIIVMNILLFSEIHDLFWNKKKVLSTATINAASNQENSPQYSSAIQIQRSSVDLTPHSSFIPEERVEQQKSATMESMEYSKIKTDFAQFKENVYNQVVKGKGRLASLEDLQDTRSEIDPIESTADLSLDNIKKPSSRTSSMFKFHRHR
ncbi:replication factor ATPase [Scheffersomyces stipitis CBS 6054]|uniref:Replication factor ATPase n=1 Tax=Scheffersomyces stipitis (strain ATCC 58785 / CBS 6054 / NBRC 10063 / NRRL Y-11545) TaxID=322104 RepID=A3LTW2_PICST|nr:replication factor ATPase [Scheffersomyces stipitis CBS 6054]ABN66135.2 replication factor ATPase [Scheffersomyces stipitis CBS 6054]